MPMRLPLLPLPLSPLLALSAALALAGCGSEKTVTASNESVSDVAKKVADAGLKPSPGRWETSMKFVKLDMEGVPPEAKAMMAKILGQDRTFATCLTKEEAEKPNAEFFGQADKNCKYDHFTMGGGKIDAKLSCNAERGARTMTMQGTYTPDTYQTTVAISGATPEGKAMSMEMQMSARHNGDCKGDELKKDQTAGGPAKP